MYKFSLFILLHFTILSFSQTRQPKNIIVMISDGCGYNQIQAANFYNGIDSAKYQKFPLQLAMSTYGAVDGSMSSMQSLAAYSTSYNTEKAWNDWTYVASGYTGSGQAATAMSTGFKTAYGAIGIVPHSNNPELITERAIGLGKSAGVVTSVPLSHATPAGFAVHNSSRNNYSQIANSFILDSKLRVVIGCGHPAYDNDGTYKNSASNWNYAYVGGQASWDSLQAGSAQFSTPSINGNTIVQDIDGDQVADCWTLVQDSAGFAQISSGSVPNRLFGVAPVYQTLQAYRSGSKSAEPYSVPVNSGMPDLALLSKAALNVLSQNKNGFFLMIEGGAIDWTCHNNSLGRLIEEETDFNNAVDSVIGWIEQHGGWSDNLLIVTGDHETGYLVGNDFDKHNIAQTHHITDNGTGNMPSAQFLRTSHTNQLIPFYAKGCGSRLFTKYADKLDVIRGPYIDNTNIAHVCFELWPIAPIEPPKNIFIVLNTGSGYNHESAFKLLSYKNPVFDTFPVQFPVSTATSAEAYTSSQAWNNWNYLQSGDDSRETLLQLVLSGSKNMDNDTERIESMCYAHGKSFGLILQSMPVINWLTEFTKNPEWFDALLFDNKDADEKLDSFINTQTILQFIEESQLFDTDCNVLPGDLYGTIDTNITNTTLNAINALNCNQNGFVLISNDASSALVAETKNVSEVLYSYKRFDAITSTIVAWIEQNSNWDESLLIVSSIGEYGCLSGIGFDTSKIYSTYPFPQSGNYGMQFNSQNHTNLLVPFYAKGKMAESFSAYANHYDFKRGRYLQTTDIHQFISKILRQLPIQAKNINSSMHCNACHEPVTSLINHANASKLIKVYPKPSKDILYLANETANDRTIKIFTSAGSCIFQTVIPKYGTINLGNLQSGVYYAVTDGQVLCIIKQ